MAGRRVGQARRGGSVRLAAMSIMLGLLSHPLSAQSVSPRWTVGVAIGGAFSRLSSTNQTARGGGNIALAWRVMYHVSDHAALGIHAGATPFHHTGAGRARRRGFEGVYPAVEWHPDREHWVAAGLGVHLDAPVFYDMRPSTPGERRFSPGLGGMLAAGRRVGSATSPTAFAGEVVARAWTGRVRTPDGLLTGWAAALLAGSRYVP